MKARLESFNLVIKTHIEHACRHPKLAYLFIARRRIVGIPMTFHRDVTRLVYLFLLLMGRSRDQRWITIPNGTPLEKEERI